MQAAQSRVTSKGQVVIPIRWIEKDGGILMVPDSEDPIKAARGMFSGSGILKAYLQEKKREKERENKRVGYGKKIRTR